MSALSQKLRRDIGSLRFCLFLIFLLVGAVCWMHWYDEEGRKKDVLVCVIHGGTRYQGIAKSAIQMKGEHAALAKTALNAIFNRSVAAMMSGNEKGVPPNPNGFLFMEDLVRGLNSTVQKQVMANAAKDVDVFKAQKISQYFIPSREIDEKQVANDAVDMGIDGDLIQIVQIQGHDPKVETYPLRVQMKLRVNPEWVENNRFEMVVVGLAVTPLKS